jgi:hypothetical protein
VGSISNRGRNYEPARLRGFCGQQNLKSHGVPRLIGGACRCMAAHMQRLPRLTLKAGRRAGCKAGSPRDGRADRGKTQKSKFAKFEISKIAKSQKSTLENFHRNFFHEIDREIVSRKIVFFLLQDQRQDFRFFVSFRTIGNVRGALLTASKQCPYEATASTRLNSHGSEERTQEDTMNPMRAEPQPTRRDMS